MDSATNLIVDYSLVHVSEAGSSVTMEKQGLNRYLDKLLAQGANTLPVATSRHNLRLKHLRYKRRCSQVK